jgi:hypothetical protein
MKRSLSLLFLSTLLFSLACSAPKQGLNVLQYSTISYPYAGPIRLYIAPEKDRSGGQYFEAIDVYDVETLQTRFKEGLRRPKLRLETYTSAGNPITLKLKNPFEIVEDSTRADVIAYLRVNGFEQGEVDVTQERMVFWNSFGMAQVWMGVSRVSRVRLEVDAQFKEVSTGEVFYAFQARGASVGEPHRRQAVSVAMDRCEIRFYEKLLRR